MPPPPRLSSSGKVYAPPPPDGPKLLAVATELAMTLYALLYAFPHIPTSLVEDVVDAAGASNDIAHGEVQWFSVRSTAALRAAMEALLRTSEVLELCLRPGLTVKAITREAVGDVARLSDVFDLQLYDAGAEIPATCRQMFEVLAATYHAIGNVEITTREELWALLQRYQVIPVGYQLPGTVRVESENRSELLRFCSELAVDWTQPYFARHVPFYLGPEKAAAPGCKAYG